MIPTEDNYADWILIGIADYFRRIGWRVRVYSIGQVKEKKLPIDRIIAVNNKILGLQFKRPRNEGPPWEYDIDVNQQTLLSRLRWGFYCFPDFTDIRLQEVALFHCMFERPSRAISGPRLVAKSSLYYRWGSFSDGFMSCLVGLVISGKEVDEVVELVYENPEIAYLVLNKSTKSVFVIGTRRANEYSQLDID
ncbi:MAG: hypothetical protein WED04_09630 [Promethearchaeati archaeon SRVP18_Atabeyarchaeia-1]